MELSNIFWIVLLMIASFGVGRFFLESKIKKQHSEMSRRLEEYREEKIKIEKQHSEMSNLFEHTLRKMREDSVILPSLARWADKIQETYDKAIIKRLHKKKRPAHKAAEEVSIARANARESKKFFELIRNRLDLYESLAPWLSDYVDYSVNDLISAFQEEKELQKNIKRDEDSVAQYVPKIEYDKISVIERNQLALDRYNDPNRKRSLWRVGVDYERFIGYEFEQQGYSVEYHGATQGKKDLGIDLICRNEREALIVQCKRLSSLKEIPVRENVIAQVFGAAEYYRMASLCAANINVRPVLVTSYILSEEARLFAKHLNVIVREKKEIRPYPMIKCNISKQNGEKIYHLPMDQQYDKVLIGDCEGEFYAKTVKEAEDNGFRRAFRWQGNSL